MSEKSVFVKYLDREWEKKNNRYQELKAKGSVFADFFKPEGPKPSERPKSNKSPWDGFIKK